MPEQYDDYNDGVTSYMYMYCQTVWPTGSLHGLLAVWMAYQQDTWPRGGAPCLLRREQVAREHGVMGMFQHMVKYLH